MTKNIFPPHIRVNNSWVPVLFQERDEPGVHFMQRRHNFKDWVWGGGHWHPRGRFELRYSGGPKIMVTFHEPVHWIDFQRSHDTPPAPKVYDDGEVYHPRDNRPPPGLTEYQRGRIERLPCGLDGGGVLYDVKTKDLEAVVRELVEILDAPNFSLPDTLPEVDLGALPLSDTWKIILLRGHDPAQPDRWPSRSECLFAAVCAMLRAGVDDTMIVAVLLDPGLGISESVTEKIYSRTYALKQVNSARKTIHVQGNR